jgi:hypothetical protein
MASDTTGGSKSVKMHAKEVMLKNKSYFRKSTGDEAGSAPLKGVVTHTNRGKVYFNAWSMDVKVEGENVVRNLDLTTHNHASAPGNTPPWPFMASMAIGPDGSDDPCAKDKKKQQSACKGKDPCKDKGCQAASKCQLVPYGGSGSPNCCPGQTGHHMIESHWVAGNAAFGMAQKGDKGHDRAPTVCAEGGRFTKEHGEFHVIQGKMEESYMAGGENAGRPWNYGAGRAAAMRAHDSAFAGSECDRACIQGQLDDFYGSNPNRALNPPKTQSLATKDPGDGRWTRGDANQSLRGTMGRR